MKPALIAAILLCAGTMAQAGPIKQACMSSARQMASDSLCGCIEAVADVTLSGTDQRRAARFFTDPEAAQKAKALDNRSAEAFWSRYANFGATASAQCAG